MSFDLFANFRLRLVAVRHVEQVAVILRIVPPQPAALTTIASDLGRVRQKSKAAMFSAGQLLSWVLKSGMVMQAPRSNLRARHPDPPPFLQHPRRDAGPGKNSSPAL